MDTPNRLRFLERTVDRHEALLAQHTAQLSAVQDLRAQLLATAARLDATLAALQELLRRGGQGAPPSP